MRGGGGQQSDIGTNPDAAARWWADAVPRCFCAAWRGLGSWQLCRLLGLHSVPIASHKRGIFIRGNGLRTDYLLDSLRPCNPIVVTSRRRLRLRTVENSCITAQWGAGNYYQMEFQRDVLLDSVVTGQDRAVSSQRRLDWTNEPAGEGFI